MIRIIENMYRTTEYIVKCQGGITPFFSSSLGIRQQCNIIQFIFINDIRNIFIGFSGFGVGEKEVYFLLYADDLKWYANLVKTFKLALIDLNATLRPEICVSMLINQKYWFSLRKEHQNLT